MAAFEGMEDDEEEMSTGFGQVDLLWKAVVKPNEALLASGVDKYFLRITNASFGPEVNRDTRTCLTIVQATDEESEAPGVVCTLKNTYENHQLDLLVSGDVQFQVSGTNPSPIYLTGHLSPAEQHVSENPFDMDDEDEPTEEDLEEMDIQTKKQLLQQLGRKRNLAAMEDDDEDKAPTFAQKKLKTASGKEKVTNPSQDKNQNKNKNQKNADNKNNQKSKNAESPKESANKKEEDAPWKNGPQGLKYKDLRVGDGKLAKKGSKVSVYYVGQLDNKKIFDKNIDGSGFEFTLGAGEVIKGWDFGVNGMKVGGKRRLQIPAKLAYGEDGSPPDIPPNSQLTFTVEVKSCN